MRKILAAAFALSLLVPTSAMAFPHGPQMWGGPGFHYAWGWGGVGLSLGLGAVVVGESACLREQPIYNASGETIGSRQINVCN